MEKESQILTSSSTSVVGSASDTAKQEGYAPSDQPVSDSSPLPDYSGIEDPTPSDEPCRPVHWSPTYRWTVMVLVSAMSMLSAFATMTIIPAVPLVLEQYHPPASYYTTLVVSIWELGEGLGPFAIGPLAEMYGRLPVLHAGNLLFLAFFIGSGLSTSASMIVAMRFMASLFITPLTLAPTLAGDLFPPESRGGAMAVAMVLPLVAPPVAPIIGSYVGSALGWRWTVWVLAIPAGVLALLLVLVFRETHMPVIVRKHAKVKTSRLGQPSAPGPKLSLQTLLRPLYLLAFAPPVSILSFHMAITYGVLYLVVTTLTEMLEGVYGFSEASVGLGFLGTATGMILGTAVFGLTSDRYLKYREKSRGKFEPEDRLPFVLIGGVIGPLGLFIYGWTAQYHVHWMAPLVGSGIIGFGMMLVQLPVENYLVDAFPAWSASAVSMAIVVRALTGAVLPLAGPSLYARLGYGWGNSLLAFLLLIMLPPIVLLATNGKRLRQSPRLDQARSAAH